MATDYELALMSQQTYQKNGGTVKGWQVKNYYCDNISGFAATEYFKKSSNETVIAFRGTDSGNDFNLLANLYTDARMALGFSPNTLRHASNCYNTHCKNQNILYQIWDWFFSGSHTLTFTGHSLGGALAELMVHEIKIKQKRDCKAVTFDSPGCANLIPKEDHAALRDTIISYKSAPNWINTLNPSLGKVYRLYISHGKEVDFTLMAWCILASLLRVIFYIALIAYLFNLGFGLKLFFTKPAFTLATFGFYILTQYINSLLGYWLNYQSGWLSNQHSIDSIVSLLNNDDEVPQIRGDVRSWPTFWQYNATTFKQALVNLLPYSDQTYNIFTMFKLDRVVEKQIENTLGYQVIKEQLKSKV